MKSDLQLQQDVLAELEFEPSVHAERIGVTVRDGVVMLAGIVPTYAEKIGAERAAKRVAGVRGLAEELSVELPVMHQRDDADIAKAAMNALEWDVFVPHQKIQIKVEKGWLTLAGKVEHTYERLHAQQDVERLAGLAGFTNDIVVKPKVSAREVKNDIEKEFKRCAVIDASHIQVETDGSRVTLRGSVPSWSEREEAYRAALAARGVASVNNQLTVS